MFKACGRCGKIHNSKYKCTAGRIYTGGEERRLRSRYAWAEKAKEIKKRSNYLCAVCRDQGRYVYDGLEVHHIEKLSERPDLLLEDANLVCLCVEHHKQADRGKIDKDYLKHLAIMRDEE